MAVHRQRSRRPRRRGVEAQVGRLLSQKGVYRAQFGEGDDLGHAAEVIAAEARRLAAAWSRQVPPSITVEVDDKTATIYSEVGPAYPNEVEDVWHPTFGHRPWKLNQHRPFLGPAVDAKASDAAARYAQKLDRLLERAGFHKE